MDVSRKWKGFVFIVKKGTSRFHSVDCLIAGGKASWSEIGFEASAWHMGSSTDGLNQQGAQMGWEDEGGTVCEEEHMVLGRPETHPLF